MTNLAMINEFAIDLTDDIAVEEAMIDAEYNEIMLLEAVVDLQEELYKTKSVQRVLETKGTYDDMAYLFVEAENEVAEDRKGIFQKFVDLIKKIATSIGNAIKGLFGAKVNDEEMIEVDEDFANPQNRNALSSFANKLGGAKGIAGIAAAALAVGGLTFLFVKSNKKAKMKVKDAKAAASQADKDKNVIVSFLSKFINDPNASSEINAQEANTEHTKGEFIKQAISWINSKINGIWNKIKSLVPGGYEEDEENNAEPTPAAGKAAPQIKGNEATVVVSGSKFIFDKSGNLINALDKTGKAINKENTPKYNKLYDAAVKKFWKLAYNDSQAKPSNGKSATDPSNQKINGFQRGQNNATRVGKANALKQIHPDKFGNDGHLINKNEAELIDILLDGEYEVTETTDGFEISVPDEVMEAFIDCFKDDEDVTTESEEIPMTESLFGTLAALEAEKDPEFDELKSLIDSL